MSLLRSSSRACFHFCVPSGERIKDPLVASSPVLTQRDENMFAEAVIELLRNEERMRDMSQNGSECIESYWAIEKAGERLM
jgi:glycosyltransferase involved in cell wall biosynthesis